MPLFSFACEQCSNISEILVRGNETPACPSCGSTKLVKQASAFAPKMGSSASSPAPSGCGACAMGGGGCPYQGG